eukprot:c19747_g1_i1 orf=290-856(+)
MSQPRMTITVGRGGQRKAILTSSQMYSDRVGGPPGNRKRPALERLGGNSSNVVSSGWQIDSKRQRQESGWKQSSFEDNDGDDLMSANFYKNDLRYKLNQKNLLRFGRPANGSFSTVKDLREKISGPVPPPKRVAPIEIRSHPSSSMKGIQGASLISASNPIAPRINPMQKTPARVEELTISSLLQSLG